ncbi:hypothetical protein DY000_02018345 [Brassica cretica]|uniref:F-box domain-containing protein n=1 Tax=Brassica cretica TaxID=69181 RepID=A0ABQ7CU04_BRACR|nr:hypothetical protein DY000_02018345 [Brassica cretica]
MPLLRFRSVSKKWKLTIDSQRFEGRHLISIQSQAITWSRCPYLESLDSLP